MFQIARSSRRVLGAAVAATALTGASVAPASADGATSHSASTLSISVAPGPITVITATGANAAPDLDPTASFGLDVYVKRPSVDPACAATQADEFDAAAHDAHDETSVYESAGGEGLGPFRVTARALVPAGRYLACAYSILGADTAATATARFTVEGAITGRVPRRTSARRLRLHLHVSPAFPGRYFVRDRYRGHTHMLVEGSVPSSGDFSPRLRLRGRGHHRLTIEASGVHREARIAVR